MLVYRDFGAKRGGAPFPGMTDKERRILITDLRSVKKGFVVGMFVRELAATVARAAAEAI